MNAISPTDVTVVVPTYNEAGNVELLVPPLLAHGYRVLIVDDGSPDGTGAIADRLAAAHDTLTVVHRSKKQGLGPAYAAGFAAALDEGAAVVCEMDADLSHAPAALPTLVAAVGGGADVAIGSRFVPGGSIENWPWRRRLLSRWGNRYARIMLGVPVKDITSGYRAFRAEALRTLDPATCAAQGYAYQVEMAWRAARHGMEIAEVPITFRDRVHGDSKLDGAIVREAMVLVTRWGISRLFGRAPSLSPEPGPGPR